MRDTLTRRFCNACRTITNHSVTASWHTCQECRLASRRYPLQTDIKRTGES